MNRALEICEILLDTPTYTLWESAKERREEVSERVFEEILTKILQI